jgi:hypothetical protein
MGGFTPMFILPTELQAYDLPTVDVAPNITALVGMASSAIDEACGRIDGDGNGSLVYTTYVQRLLLQTRNRNLVMLPMRPIAPLTQIAIDALQALAASGMAASGVNYFYTGALANTLNQQNGTLSGIVAASGRYGYSRQDMSIAYPDLFAFINPLNLVTMFGGPAPWVSIDITNTDYDPRTGEVWVPAGLQLQKYSEILITYNAGFDPTNMPPVVKYVCASMVKNLLAKGAGTTGMTSMSLGRSAMSYAMQPGIIDPMLDQMLAPFKTVRSY